MKNKKKVKTEIKKKIKCMVQMGMQKRAKGKTVSTK